MEFMQRYRRERWVTKLAWATSRAVARSEHNSKPFTDAASKIHKGEIAILRKKHLEILKDLNVSVPNKD